jgi:multisubunit Na+/H+ antiporter MnhF subunit
MNWLFGVAYVILTFVFVGSLYRIIRGPTNFDRLASFDLLTAAAMGAFALLSVTLKQELLFDISILICFMGFIGTIGLAKLISKDEEGL